MLLATLTTPRICAALFLISNSWNSKGRIQQQVSSSSTASFPKTRQKYHIKGSHAASVNLCNPFPIRSSLQHFQLLPFFPVAFALLRHAWASRFKPLVNVMWENINVFFNPVIQGSKERSNNKHF